MSCFSSSPRGWSHPHWRSQFRTYLYAPLLVTDWLKEPLPAKTGCSLLEGAWVLQVVWRPPPTHTNCKPQNCKPQTRRANSSLQLAPFWEACEVNSEAAAPLPPPALSTHPTKSRDEGSRQGQGAPASSLGVALKGLHSKDSPLLAPRKPEPAVCLPSSALRCPLTAILTRIPVRDHPGQSSISLAEGPSASQDRALLRTVCWRQGLWVKAMDSGAPGLPWGPA